MRKLEDRISCGEKAEVGLYSNSHMTKYLPKIMGSSSGLYYPGNHLHSGFELYSLLVFVLPFSFSHVYEIEL